MAHRPPTRRTLAPCLIAFVLAGTACGSSDRGTQAASPEPAAFDAAAYCKASLAIEQSAPDIDYQTATPEEMAVGIKAWASGDLQPLFDEVAAAAPSELDEAVEAYRAAIQELAETGDPEVFEQQGLQQAEETTHAFDLEHCGWSTAEVVAEDFAFRGLEAAYGTGPISIDLTNEGEEVHELLVLKAGDGTDETVEELMELAEDELFAKVEWVGGIDPVAPGDRDYVIVDLEPGRYVVTCFLGGWDDHATT